MFSSLRFPPPPQKTHTQVVSEVKERSAVVLTTHSMEEAETLCNRLGVFVRGRLQCIGNPKVNKLHPRPALAKWRTPPIS